MSLRNHIRITRVRLRTKYLTDTDVINFRWIKLGSLESCLKVVRYHNAGMLMSLTLNKACSISSTGMSLNCPFFAFPIAVRFAKVMTTSSGFCCRMAPRPRGVACVDAARRWDGTRNRSREDIDSILNDRRSAGTAGVKLWYVQAIFERMPTPISFTTWFYI